MSDNDGEELNSSGSETEEEETPIKGKAPTAKPEEEDGEEEPLKTPAKKAPTTKATPKTPGSAQKRSYIQRIHDAIVAMKDRTGSSQIAIQKYILANCPDLDEKKLKQHLLKSLKQGVAKKQLVKIKASYKIHPNAKKKPKSKKKMPPKPKKLTPAQLAAQREKEEKERKEKERQERIRKRKFPMEDLALIPEDRELGVSVDLPPRPSYPLVFPEFTSACKSDSMGSGLMDDALHVYHFFRGDVGWKRKEKNVVAPFTLDQWLGSIRQILSGNAKKARMLPPLMSHLFVVALQYLVPSELQLGLTPASWSEVLMLYMDAMERYYTTEASEDPNAIPGLAIDTDYLLGVTDEPKNEADLEPPTSKTSSFYLQGNLFKAHSKLLTLDPWMLSAEELVSLLKALVDDMLAELPECAADLEDRLQETYELLKVKRAADASFRKLSTTRNKEQAEDKDKEKEQHDSGEKATRSNSKLPSVSEAKVESARRAQQKATSAYEKNCKSQRIRTEKIGEDRNYHAVYHFWNDPQLVFVLHKGKNMPSQASFKVPDLNTYRTTWYTLDKRSVVEKYLESLDVRGKRESALQEALRPACKFVHDDIKILNDQKAVLKEKQELQRKLENAKLKCEFGRKSGRLAAQSEQEFSVLQAEIDLLEECITEVKKEPVKVNLEFETGLEVLREFDRQEEHDQRRRATRRDTQKQQEDEDEDKLPKLQCSRLWGTGNIDGTGIVGSIVWNLLELEERVESLASWENGDRKRWIANLENAAHSWHVGSPPMLEDDDTNTPVSSPEGENAAKKQKTVGTPGSVGSASSAVTSSQVLSMLKQPLLELEGRVFEMTGLAMASRDSDEADDNMSASPEENEQEQLQMAWKKTLYRLHRLPAKAHSKIRQTLVEAIAAARKAQLALVVGQLREALLQFHPEAAGSCKAAALKILETHGGYDDTDDDEEDEDDMDEGEAELKGEAETGISSVLCAEALILNSSLDGMEDASRSDWIGAAKKTKTISKMAALVAAFCNKVSEKLEKMEAERDALNDVLEAWGKASSLRKKKNTEDIPGPSEVWTNVNFSDEFCLAKVEKYPWWPAKKCTPKDEKLAESLELLERSVVSLVGESGGLRVVKNENLLPFSESLPDDEELGSHPKDVRNQLEDCMTMARRIIRGKQKKASKKKNKSTGGNDFREEKKLST